MTTRTQRRLVGRFTRPSPMVNSIATGVVGQSILVISGVVVARALGPEHRGVLALVFVLTTIAAQVGGLGVPASVTYWIAARGTSPRALLGRLRRFRRLQLAVVLAAQSLLIIFVLEPRSPPGYLAVAMLSLAATAATLSQLYGLAVLQGLGRFTALNVLRTSNAALYLLGVVALWAAGQATLDLVTLAYVGASVLSAGATAATVARERTMNRPIGDVSTREVVSFGLRSLLGSAPPVETFRLDQLMVGLMLSPIALGYYVVALAFTNLTRFIGQSIGLVTYPRVAAAPDRTSQVRIIRRDFALCAIVCGSATAVLIVAVPLLLPFFFGPAFSPATSATQILMVAALFASLRRVLVDGTRGAGWPSWGAVAEVLTLAVVPAIVVVNAYSDSLTAVAAVVAVANLAGLLVLAPALLTGIYRPIAAPPPYPALARPGDRLVVSITPAAAARDDA